MFDKVLIFLLLGLFTITSASCSSWFSGSEPLPMSSSDRAMVKNTIVQLGPIPQIINQKNKEKTKVYVFAFDGTENDRFNVNEDIERQTIVGYLSNKLEENWFDVEYEPGPGVGNKFDTALGYSCRSKAEAALELLKSKIPQLKDSSSNIKIVVLGFSRGASIARHFMNIVSETWPIDEEEISSHSVRSYGLLFDTVAMSTNELKLGIAPTSDYLVHIIARDERRTFFPLVVDNDLAFEKNEIGNLVITPRLTQIKLPGAHSDIGASYKYGIGTFYRALGELVLQQYGLIGQLSIKFSDNFFSQGSHDSSGTFDKLVDIFASNSDPNDRSEEVIKSIPISFEHAKRLKKRNENNINVNASSYMEYNETPTLKFIVTKRGNSLEIVKYNQNIKYATFEFEEGDRYIAFEFYILPKKQRLFLSQKAWDLFGQNEKSTIEFIPLVRGETSSLRILVNDVDLNSI